MIPVITIRAEPGASATIKAGWTRGGPEGLAIAAHPLWEIAPVPWAAPDPASVDGLLIGSANALRHAGPQLSAFAAHPVHAVGQATGALAAAMGHRIASVGTGGLQAVLGGLGDAPLRLLRLTGEVHLPLVPARHVMLVTRIVYSARPLPMPAALADLLHARALVLLHSAEAARHFAAECDRLGAARERIMLAALGPRIAALAGTGWADCRSADRPDEAALLALAAKMCQ